MRFYSMSDKKNRLIERAKQTVRQPKPANLVSSEPKKNSYKVIAISLYSPEAEWIDQITKMLQLAGNPKANRSLVVREAILRMQEEMSGKDAQEILQSFIESHSKRIQLF
jgi:hypothetical protein